MPFCSPKSGFLLKNRMEIYMGFSEVGAGHVDSLKSILAFSQTILHCSHFRSVLTAKRTSWGP